VTLKLAETSWPPVPYMANLFYLFSIFIKWLWQQVQSELKNICLAWVCMSIWLHISPVCFQCFGIIGLVSEGTTVLLPFSMLIWVVWWWSRGFSETLLRLLRHVLVWFKSQIPYYMAFWNYSCSSVKIFLEYFWGSLNKTIKMIYKCYKHHWQRIYNVYQQTRWKQLLTVENCCFNS